MARKKTTPRSPDSSPNHTNETNEKADLSASTASSKEEKKEELEQDSQTLRSSDDIPVDSSMESADYIGEDTHYSTDTLSSGEEENEDAVDAAAEDSGDLNHALKSMMNQNFIEYASYVIKDRAIPDVDDGLKPVQRRILWVMHENDTGNFDKVANIIGNTMHYHPHGDASIGDALVNLANKEFFIERQGNFGHVMTGAPAAAPRYIEARLTPLAREVLFNRDITLMVDSYDGRHQEPVVLPAKVPALLLQGADGIAVGTNTKIMPHNFNEVLQAQISYLKGEPFTLYPDFLQGGIMDVSKYEDGLGKLTVRAKLEIEGRNIKIREIPPATDTRKLMDSIENAINKSKIKIAACHDYTAAQVEIELVPIRGYQPEKALNALYTYTYCQMGIACNPMVILDNRPVRMSVTEILKRNTDRLVQYLTWELQLSSIRALEKILVRTLAQIFIEERIYKRIEKCPDKDAMFKEVRTGLEKFKSEWQPIVFQLHEMIVNGPHVMPPRKEDVLRMEQLSKGIIPDSDIDRLVEIPIRRIAAFEIDRNRQDIESLQKELEQNLKNLKRIKAYTIKYIQGLLDKYGALYPRRTQICLEGFEKIDKSAIALNNIRVGWDKKNCYIGTNVKSEDTVLCNEFDHLLCIERTGDYKVINIPEKIYIDRLFEFRKYDKNTEFGIIYSDRKTGKVYYKRSVISSFTTDREYRIIPEGCRLELITPRPKALYDMKVDTPIKARQIQRINLMDAPLRSPKAGGSPLSPRKLLKITFVQYLDGTEENDENPQLLELPETDEKSSGSADFSTVNNNPPQSGTSETFSPTNTSSDKPSDSALSDNAKKSEKSQENKSKKRTG